MGAVAGTGGWLLAAPGTPEGVAAVVRGDVLEGEIAGVGTVRTRIA